MPKSKRNKQIELSKTKKRGLEWKKHLFEEIRTCVDSYANVFVFSVNDMRNSKMKNVRDQWKHSRFFIGKNKIMAMALGRFSEEEYKPNLHKLGQQLKGQRGMLFSNKPAEEVLSWFHSYSEGDYARSGNIATEDVKLPAGPLSMFPHNLEPYLRQLGLPTSLVKGVIHLVKDHEVCKAGDALSPETARILKLLGYEMAEFHLTIECMWSQDGSFMMFNDKIETNAKENRKSKKKKSGHLKKKISLDIEEMEVEVEKANAAEAVETTGFDNSTTDFVTKEKSFTISPVKILNSSFTNKSIQNIDLMNNNTMVEDKNNISIVEIAESKHTAKKFSSTPKSQLNSIDDIKCGSKESPVKITESGENLLDSLKITESEENLPESPEDNDKKSEKLEEVKEIKQTRSRKRKVNKIMSRNETLQKTPEIANSSQDSPVFRQLRNRSVKVSKKKKAK